MLLLMPNDFYTGRTFAGMGSQVSNCFYETDPEEYYFELASKDYTTEPPQNVSPQIIQKVSQDLAKYNHLIDHSTFKFCFNYETIFTANLRYLTLKNENNK